MATFTVGYLIGSLAAGSINRQVSKALVRLAPPELALREIPIRDLPLYSYDYDADPPAAARAFKEAFAGVQALLFVTPEYNRSIPGALKNAIDWGTRPRGQNAFAGKPSAIIGASTGRIGTAVAQQHLRTMLVYCGSPQLPFEAYLQFEKGLIGDDGQVTNPSTETFLRKFMSEFHGFLKALRGDVAVPGAARPRDDR